MNFTDTELNILRNFAKINPSQIIKPKGFGARELSNSIVGIYNFESEYEFEPFGIYEVPMFLQAIDTFANPDIEIKSDRVVIKEGSAKVQFFTTPLDLIKKSEVPDVGTKFDKLECELDFDLSADKLATIFKTASVFKARYLYFETDNDSIRLTVSSDSPGTSGNSFQVAIRDNIRSNNLGDIILKIPLTELRIIPGDYAVKISSKKISKWSSYSDVTYFVGCMLDS